ncbi:site-specific integrase [Enterococcus avium]|uniref:site-specific integrase n=1 Tax=Enterococcus avium TaxID=33945 RepID=UPI001C12804D|nr:site-specific integrase [Enterococcus avium]MBU5369592.1 tyrosine-type recombinase/integrase [Enterococcus avium]MDT2422093.1 tyrosine-type recombinase/integrase [Enterococcus avium]
MATFEQYKKKNGSTAWLFRTYLGVDQSTGKQITTTRRGFKTKKDAALAENRLKIDFQKNGLHKTNASTFKEIYELWYESYKKTVKESTSIATERYIKLHVLPLFGDTRVDKINIKAAQKAVNKWADQLQVYKVVLQYVIKIMNYAIHLELIEFNPFDKVIRPQAKDKKRGNKVKYYTADQVKTAMSVLEQRVRKMKDTNLLYLYFAEFDLTFYRLLAFTGLRGGEALALEWNDIDFDKKRLTVSKSISQTRKGFKVSSPKTKSSYRTITLDDKTVRTLKRWQLRTKEMHFTNGVKNVQIIFPDLDGNYIHRQNIYMRSKRVAKFADLPDIGTHGWRHTHASMLFESGVSMKEAQERLGHSSIEMTMNIYTHLSQKSKDETVEKLAKFANF